MSDPLDYTATIKAKGLDETGFTVEHARQAAQRLGGHTILIIEVLHDELTTKSEGNPHLKLKIINAEPVPEHLEERVREFKRALYRTRPEVAGQAVLTGTDQGLTPDEALQSVDATVERDEHGHVVGVWDGDLDAPLEGQPQAAGLSAVPDPPEGGYCPFPGCDLENEHEGDHAEPGDDEDGS